MLTIYHQYYYCIICKKYGSAAPVPIYAKRFSVGFDKLNLYYTKIIQFLKIWIRLIRFFPGLLRFLQINGYTIKLVVCRKRIFYFNRRFFNPFQIFHRGIQNKLSILIFLFC